MAPLRRQAGPPGVSLERDRLDLLRAEFERKWLSGEHPRIEDFLQDTDEPLRSTALVELVKLDVQCRRRNGESPGIDDYARRFPQFADQLLDSWDADPEKTVSFRSAAVEFAHFELRDLLGRGSYGDVWMAFDRRLERIVALKLPRRESLDDRGADVFRREARAAAQLRHPNIVRTYEVGEEADTTYIVSEYIEGINLRDYLHAQPSRVLPFRDAAELVAKLADGLEHAHARGVIHRDLKPANILLDRQGEPHIADFGLAKRISIEVSATADGLRLGTVPYMSPEQAAGDSNRVDARSDVFSLGVILYETLTGQRPFRGEEHVVIHRILTEEPESPGRVRKDMPRDLESICLKALEKHPQRRYASARELAADLRRFLNGEPVHARPVRAVGRIVRRVRRSPGPAVAVASSVLCLGVAAVLAVYGLARDQGVPAMPAADPPRRVRLETKPHGATVVFVPISDKDGKPLADRLFRAPMPSPVEVDLTPGDYWVVADLPGHGFHEVRRHVPRPGSSADRWYSHRSWTVRGDLVELPSVEIPDSAILDGMARFSGSDRFIAGDATDLRSPRHSRNVREFYLDATETTLATYKRLHADAIPRVMRDMDVTDQFAAVGLEYERAVHLAEKLGKRLPDEWEYEFAATDGGTRAFPWGDSPDLLRQWSGEIGPVGEPEWDRVEQVDYRGNRVTVYGLCTNVAEWTDSWPDSALLPLRLEHNQFDVPYYFRVVRGGSEEVIDGEVDATLAGRSPRLRTLLARKTFNKPGLGFRCARSTKPRLNPHDWRP